MKASIYLILFTVLAISCQTKRDKVEKVIKEWQGKEILIPDVNFAYNVLGRDTILGTDLWDKPYKILTYIDSIGCSACQMEIPLWMELMDSCKLQQLDVSFIFVIHSDDFIKLGHDVQIFGFDHPIIYDYQNSFDKINHFPPPPYRSFLLDKDNKVQLIGLPIKNPKMWELYKKTITQSQETSSRKRR